MMMLSQIPTELKDPGFFQWVGYLMLLIYVVEKIGGGFLKLTGRDSPAKREISGTVMTKEPVTHADQADVDELREEFRALREATEAQFNAARVAGEHRVQSLSEVIDAEVEKMEHKFQAGTDSITREMRDGFAALSHKLDPMLILSGQHEVLLKDLKPRFEAHLSKHSDQMAKVHERINDAMERLRQVQPTSSKSTRS